jgi:hypothetical protein
MTTPSEDFESGLSDVRSILETSWGYTKPKTGEIKALGETVRFLTRFRESQNLSDNEDRFLQTWVDQASDVLIRPFKTGRALNLKYYSSDRGEDRWGEQNKVLASLLSLEAIEIEGPELGRGSTTWDIVVRGIAHLYDEIERGLDRYHDEEQTGDLYFIIFNTLEVFDVLENPEHLRGDAAKFRSLVESYEGDLRNKMNRSPGLKVYTYDLAHRGLISTDVEEPPFQGDVFHALGRLNRGESVQPSNIDYNHRSPHLYAIARAWARVAQNEDSGVIPFYRNIDIDEVYRRVWGDPQQIANETISRDQVDTVVSMDDSEIQKHLFEILSTNEKLTQESRSALGQELRKSHTGAEISDFDIEMELDDRVVSVSFPIKSGVEAGNKTADKLAEGNLHQIVRPATRFKTERVAVFPILIAGLTLNANETIKTWRSNFDIPIAVIDRDEFTRILLHHGVL